MCSEITQPHRYKLLTSLSMPIQLNIEVALLAFPFSGVVTKPTFQRLKPCIVKFTAVIFQERTAMLRKELERTQNSTIIIMGSGRVIRNELN